MGIIEWLIDHPVLKIQRLPQERASVTWILSV